MTSYSGVYYTYMREQRKRASHRAMKVIKNFERDNLTDVDLDYAQNQLINYLIYKKNMIKWRRNMKNVAILKKNLEEKQHGS